MNSLKNLKNLTYFSRIKTKIKPAKSNKGLKSLIELKKKRKRKYIKKDVINKRTKKTVVQVLKLILKLQNRKIVA